MLFSIRLGVVQAKERFAFGAGRPREELKVPVNFPARPKRLAFFIACWPTGGEAFP